MFIALLRMQYRDARWWLLALALAVVAFPLYVLAAASGSFGGTGADLVLPLLSGLRLSGVMLAFMTFLVAIIISMLMWKDDSVGKHVYALALPVPRWYYLLLRLSVGFTFIALLSTVLWLSALFAASQMALPPGLHAYPTGLALRFALSTTLIFALFFALAALPKRSQIAVIITAYAAMLLAAWVLNLSDSAEPLQNFLRGVGGIPGLFDTFTTRWMLIDV